VIVVGRVSKEPESPFIVLIDGKQTLLSRSELKANYRREYLDYLVEDFIRPLF
jgi:hypothetical protein